MTDGLDVVAVRAEHQGAGVRRAHSRVARTSRGRALLRKAGAASDLALDGQLVGEQEKPIDWNRVLREMRAAGGRASGDELDEQDLQALWERAEGPYARPNVPTRHARPRRRRRRAASSPSTWRPERRSRPGSGAPWIGPPRRLECGRLTAHSLRATRAPRLSVAADTRPPDSLRRPCRRGSQERPSRSAARPASRRAAVPMHSKAATRSGRDGAPLAPRYGLRNPALRQRSRWPSRSWGSRADASPSQWHWRHLCTPEEL
jgi:hypothetical protein